MLNTFLVLTTIGVLLFAALTCNGARRRHILLRAKLRARLMAAMDATPRARHE